jgi:hypothetical protein
VPICVSTEATTSLGRTSQELCLYSGRAGGWFAQCFWARFARQTVMRLHNEHEIRIEAA